MIKNLRITDHAIEFDLYVNDEASKKKTTDAFAREYGSLLNERDLRDESQVSVPSQFQDKEETVRLSLSLFNEQRYWECHETLEQIWRRQEKGEEKDIQQGIILAASALVHFQKNEDSVCIGMIPRALAKLGRWNKDYYFSFNIEKLKKSLEEMRKSGKVFNPVI